MVNDKSRLLDVKKYRILVICLVVYFVIMGVILYFSLNKSDEKVATVFVDNYSHFLYSDSKWSKLSYKDLNDYSWQKYDLYVYNEFMGNYYLMKNDNVNKWHIFDDDKNPVSWKSGIVAFGGDLKHHVKSVEVVDISSSDREYVYEVLQDLKISDNDFSSFTSKVKYLVDLDSDGNNEEIYSIGNAFSKSKRKKDFSIIFFRKNNKNIIIYKLINNAPSDNIFSGCLPSVQSVFTLGNDKNPKIIVNCEFFSGTSFYNNLYEYDIYKNKINSLMNDFYSQ